MLAQALRQGELEPGYTLALALTGAACESEEVCTLALASVCRLEMWCQRAHMMGPPARISALGPAPHSQALRMIALGAV